MLHGEYLRKIIKFILYSFSIFRVSEDINITITIIFNVWEILNGFKVIFLYFSS